MIIDIPSKTFFLILKKHPEMFPDWRDEGTKFWNSRTGEILYEDGTVMYDLVYRGSRNYNNYWKECFNDEPKSFTYTGETPKVTLAEEIDVYESTLNGESIVQNSLNGESLGSFVVSHNYVNNVSV